MKYLRIPQDILIYFVLPKHHIRAGISVKGKVSVPVRKCLHKCQRCPDVFVRHQIGNVNSRRRHNLFQTVSENVLPHFADKRSLSFQFCQHGEHIARRTAGIRLVNRIPLSAGTVLRKVNQQFSKCSHVVFLHSPFPPI